MKIRKKYTLYVNPMTGYAFYGGLKFSIRIYNASLGQIYDCTFNQLKYNINKLTTDGYTILCMKH